MDSYDLLVIGSGPAGQRAAIQAAKSGKRVALIERREVVGGACINTGTIPSKTMREAVLHLSGFQYQGIYGVNYRVKEKITMADLAFRVQQVIKTEIDVTQAQLFRNGITVLTADASFVDPHTGRKSSAHAARRRCHADRVVIATGTKPADVADGAAQRPHHHQQRPGAAAAGDAEDADRGRRRRHRRRVRVHVRHARRARHARREAAAAAGVRRRRDRGGALLPPARSPRHDAPERGGRARRGDAGRRRGRHAARAQDGSPATRCSTRSAGRATSTS